MVASGSDDTCGLRWRSGTGGIMQDAPVVTGNAVYAASDDHVYALDAATGRLKWSFRTEDTPHLAVAAGVVYVGDHEDYVYALSAETGELVLAV